MKRKAQVLNFWNEFSSSAKVPKVKDVKICINMIWKLEFEMHIIGVKASHFLIFLCHMEWLCTFLWKKTGYYFCPHYIPCPPFFFYFVLSIYWAGVYSYSSGLANDIHGLMTCIVMLKATGCPNDKYLNFLVYNHSNFLCQKAYTLLSPYIGTWVQVIFRYLFKVSDRCRFLIFIPECLIFSDTEFNIWKQRSEIFISTVHL